MTYLLALIAALAYGANWVLQQHEAAQAPTGLQLHPVRLVEHLLRRPMWLAGLAALIVGSGIQELALAWGSLPVVEALLVLALVFALVFANRMSPHSVTATQWIGAVVVCVGLAGFLIAGDPTTGHGWGANSRWLDIVVVFGAVCAVLSAAAWRTTGSTRAALCATAAAALFGLSDALSKAAFNFASKHGYAPMLVHWQVWGLLGAAVVGVGLSQVAYNAAPLAVSLPSLAVVEPIAGLIVGIVVLHVHFRHGTAAVTVEILAAVAVVVGSLVMGRSRVLNLRSGFPADTT